MLFFIYHYVSLFPFNEFNVFAPLSQVNEFETSATIRLIVHEHRNAWVDHCTALREGYLKGEGRPWPNFVTISAELLNHSNNSTGNRMKRTQMNVDCHTFLGGFPGN